jgi:hypothetical protein
MQELENFYLKYKEPVRSCFLTLKEIILKQDSLLSSEWKYGMPFFYYSGKMFCYLWFHKKYKQPYIGIVEGYRLNHSELMAENRSRIKIFLINPEEDIPIKKIQEILNSAIKLYKQ